MELPKASSIKSSFIFYASKANNLEAMVKMRSHNKTKSIWTELSSTEAGSHFRKHPIERVRMNRVTSIGAMIGLLVRFSIGAMIGLLMRFVESW